MLKHCKACLEYMHTDKPVKDKFCDYQCYSMYLEDENKRLKEVLKLYADKNEWYSISEKSPWNLNFNSGHVDGHGYEIAESITTTRKGR